MAELKQHRHVEKGVIRRSESDMLCFCCDLSSARLGRDDSFFNLSSAVALYLIFLLFVKSIIVRLAGWFVFWVFLCLFVLKLFSLLAS